MAGMSLAPRQRGTTSSVRLTSLKCKDTPDSQPEHALILLSNNGKNDLSHLQFDNFFARSYDKAGVIWYTASIVVTAPGDYRIRHSIVATRAGTTKTAAFQLLMLDIETKLDAVLRGNGVNNGGLPIKQSKKKRSSGSVDIISRPSQAMRKPTPKPDDCNTWSGAPMTASPKSKPSTVFSHSSKDSQDTQPSTSSSKYSQGAERSEPAAPTVTASPPSVKLSPTLPHVVSVDTAAVFKRVQHVRHASAPLQPKTSHPPPFRKATRHFSQPPKPKLTAQPETIIKALPALPLSSSPEKPATHSDLSQIHPALRPKSPEASTETLRPPPTAKSCAASLASSSVYSRPQSPSPVSPLNENELAGKDLQPLSIASIAGSEEKQVCEDVEAPSPLHFEKPIASKPARVLGKGMEFEIYV